MAEAYDNEQIRTWAKSQNLTSIKTEIDALGIKHSKRSTNPVPLKSALRVALREKNGMVDKISYKFPRSAVFVHKGVGNGTPIEMVGQTNRVPKRWFDSPTERNIPDLQRIVAEQDCTYVINNLTIK